MPIIFGPEAAGTNERLYTMMRRATLKRDENAPIYPTLDEVARLDNRKDMQKLKQACETARDDLGANDPSTQRAYAAYAKLQNDLRGLIVDKQRMEYFAEVDRRRSLGLPTSDMVTPTEKLWKPPRPRTRIADQDATRIGLFLSEKELGGQRRRQIFSRLLLAYMGNRGTEVGAIMDSLAGTEKPQDESKQPPQKWTCLLCRKDYSFRSGLTRHNQNAHFLTRAFDRPFPCPECDRRGKEKHLVEGVEQWSNHVEQCHGIMYTPCLPSKNCQKKSEPAKPKPAKTRSANCLLCGSLFFPGTSFSRHINREHRSQKSFTCLGCCDPDNSNVVPTEDWAAWIEHEAKVHKRDAQTGAEVLEQTVLGKRKRGGCKDGVPSTVKHPRSK